MGVIYFKAGDYVRLTEDGIRKTKGDGIYGFYKGILKVQGTITGNKCYRTTLTHYEPGYSIEATSFYFELVIGDASWE